MNGKHRSYGATEAFVMSCHVCGSLAPSSNVYYVVTTYRHQNNFRHKPYTTWCAQCLVAGNTRHGPRPLPPSFSRSIL
ncbi:hypothetical protein GDO81_025237 [Engystomops pustulosus]|uniref:Uncharacterized protein n=1 Tax=Engystomops pustulosus TaxID=76066 RepID=A0AAV6Z0S0_ENGPU|nr:hypothetical protein GDO81_025237 [Engystomops pustulosus]